MGDMGDDFNALKKYRQQKRADNRESSPALLRKAGIEFQILNLGAHIQLKHEDVFIDFWPGTGLWMRRGSKKRNYGVSSLIAIFNKTNKVLND